MNEILNSLNIDTDSIQKILNSDTIPAAQKLKTVSGALVQVIDQLLASVPPQASHLSSPASFLTLSEQFRQKVSA